MKKLSYFFFYTYIGLVIIAGFWGAFINPKYDFLLLMEFDLSELEIQIRTDLLSQYRFLRALELGFGLFAIHFVQPIFHTKSFNTLFLIIMGSGILARIVSLIVDGVPGAMHLFFMSYELIGLLLIYLYTKKTIAQNAFV